MSVADKKIVLSLIIQKQVMLHLVPRVSLLSVLSRSRGRAGRRETLGTRLVMLGTSTSHVFDFRVEFGIRTFQDRGKEEGNVFIELFYLV